MEKVKNTVLEILQNVKYWTLSKKILYSFIDFILSFLERIL